MLARELGQEIAGIVQVAGDPTKVGDGAGGTLAVGVGAVAVGAHPIVVRVDVSRMTWVRFFVT